MSIYITQCVYVVLCFELKNVKVFHADSYALTFINSASENDIEIHLNEHFKTF